MNDDPFTQTRLDVAEMKGMLTQALGSHGQRLTALEEARDKLHASTIEHSTTQASHTAKIQHLEERAKGQMPRILQVLMAVLAVLGFLGGVGGEILLRR